jgi:hypothetical protein
VDSPDYIALASAVFSGVAAGFGGLAFWQSRRSANAADRSADAADRSANAADQSAASAAQLAQIEASRHYEERRPKWDVKLEKVRRGYTGPRRLVLELVSPEEVDEAVALSVDGKLTFRESQEGVDFAGDRAETVRPVTPGRWVAWEVTTPQPPEGGTARIEVISMIDGETWNNVFHVALPARPGRVISY